MPSTRSLVNFICRRARSPTPVSRIATPPPRSTFRLITPRSARCVHSRAAWKGRAGAPAPSVGPRVHSTHHASLPTPLRLWCAASSSLKWNSCDRARTTSPTRTARSSSSITSATNDSVQRDTARDLLLAHSSLATRSVPYALPSEHPRVKTPACNVRSRACAQRTGAIGSASPQSYPSARTADHSNVSPLAPNPTPHSWRCARSCAACALRRIKAICGTRAPVAWCAPCPRRSGAPLRRPMTSVRCSSRAPRNSPPAG